MKTKILAATIVLGMSIAPFALVACGDSGGAGGGSGTGQNCTSEHVCVNNVCNCGSDGKGKSCSSNTACDSECEVCN